MASYLTTNTLIESIKRKAMLPTTQNTFTNQDFLAFLNEEMDIGLVPSILSLHEEYYVYSEDVALTANKSNYTIPYRAMGNKLRDLFYVDANGNLTELSRIQPEDKAFYQLNESNGGYIYFYLEGNDVIIIPSIGSAPTGSLRFSYYLSPSDLVSEDRVAVITAIASVGGTTTYTVDGVPTGMSTATLVDVLQEKSGHKIRAFDLTPTSVNSISKTIAFDDADVPEGVVVGDHIAFAQECIIPQAPSELHNVLAQRVAARCLEALNDTQGLTNANAKLAEMEVKLQTIIDARVEGAPQKVNNMRGLLHYSRVRRTRWS